MPRKRISAKTKIEDPWTTLSDAILKTLSERQSDTRLMMLNQACDDLVRQNKLDILYDGLVDHLNNHFNKWHDELRSLASDALLKKLSDQYTHFKHISVIIPTMYSSYDRHFSSEPHKILNMIRNLFSTKILSDENLIDNSITPLLIDHIISAQNGSEIDLNVIKNVIQMYYSFNNANERPDIFNNFFDKLVKNEINSCETFFRDNFRNSSFTTYLTKVENKYKIFNPIICYLFKQKDANEILTCFNITLLYDREDDFLIGQEPLISQALISENPISINYLVKAYHEFGRDITPLYVACANYISTEMLAKTRDFHGDDFRQSNVPQLMDDLIKLTLKLEHAYKNIFKDKEAMDLLEQKISNAWSDVSFDINNNFNLYINSLVKSKFRGYENSDLLISKIIPQFYRYLQEKVKFNIVYEMMFVRRLVEMKSVCLDIETPIIKNIQKLYPDFMIHYDEFKKTVINSNAFLEEYQKNTLDQSLDQSSKIDLIPFICDFQLYPSRRKDPYKNVPSMVYQCNKNFLDHYHFKEKK